MGKGDKRTKKGKRWNGSYGNSRPKPEDEQKKKEAKQKNS
ncbi:MAG: 30S ribosomal protein THX [Mameliella sp.]|nr:30S ribosomal protein THX [Phaeodactylibacter sp.]NRA50000.1 30S ribosomal protein THX [Phaeodactylibacter sp.]